MKAFIKERNNFQDAFLRREGRGPWWSKGCMGDGCLALRADYRCEDCFGGRLLCKICVVNRHRDEPLHIIQQWKDGYFQPCPLTDVDPGLRFQIGHRPGEDCDFRDGPNKFVVLDNNAIHEVAVDFCGCVGAASPNDQLLNIGWFPATVKNPETCATLSVLRRFHTLNLQGRVPAYDFYNALEVLSDRAGMRRVPNRREQFTLMAREYRHLQMCKRAGRGHDGNGVEREKGDAPTETVYGIDATAPGGLAIPCRACPIPGVNLPPGWENAPIDKAWLYQLLLSEDANFKMKGRATSTRAKDPTLGPGYAYMVAHDKYLKHLVKYIEEGDEISHCVAFAALWRANNKRAKGLRASGIGSVSCSRHEVFRPNGMGDLQKGERYCNMDYLFFSSLIGMTLLSIIASYDIACQWFRNFGDRMKKMPEHMRLPASVKIQFKVPKFHLPPHVKKCHGPFSFNYTKWVGRTDGEGVERNWSWLNMIARSVSVMGPGSRENTIDDFCGFANWRKTVGLGNSLLRKMVLSIPKAMLHNRAFHAFSEGLKEGHLEELIQWEQSVRAWEQDHTKPCPYDYPEEEDLTLEDVRLRIAEEQHAREEQSPLAVNNPGAFILAGMEIESHQYVLQRYLDGRRHRTTIQATKLQRKRTLLLAMIKRLRDSQGAFMPGLAKRLENEPAQKSRRPEDTKLYLPSFFPKEEAEGLCVKGLVEEESRLRQAQAVTALRDLRRHLRIRTVAFYFKRKHTAGQAAYTKSQALQSSIEVHIRGAVTQYQTARAALLQLRGPGEWERIFLVLQKSDVRGMNERTLNREEEEEERQARIVQGLPPDGEELDEFGEVVVPTVLFNLELGEGKRFLSWIWYTTTTTTTGDTTADGKLHDDIRVEWTKARARADRWREELILLDEEMRRVLVYCEWKAHWWRDRRVPRTGISPELKEGLCAYALEQEARERWWAEKWAAKWAAVRARAKRALEDDVLDVTEELPIEVEVDDDVAYGEYSDEEEEDFDDLD
ncbi:hypothetical protein C8R43DRAFT_871124 [Mycena crocata]|nr:hypothetical protein C8R43DRAFT_871124 [Mycena crocata]